MDLIRSLFKREIESRAINSYDLAIKRLKCYDYNEFCGIYPSSADQAFAADSPVFACNFCRKENYQHWLALANEDGLIAVQDTSIRSKRSQSGDIYAEGTQAHHNAIFDLAWMEDELKLVSVSGDHTAVLWDVSVSPFRELQRFKGHTRSVKTVAFRPQDKAVFATGARDGVIMVWDIRSNQGPLWDKPDNFISNSHHAAGQGTPTSASSRNSRRSKSTSSSRANSITGLVFQDQDCLLSCGAGDGLIKVWDLRKNYSAYRREPLPCYTLPYLGNTARNGFTNLVLDPGKVKLYANCMDSVIYCYNVATYEQKPVATYTGHQNATFYVKSCLSPDGLYLASGSSDDRAYIWNTNGSKRPVACLVGHGAEVTSVQWCPVGDTKIVTCSDDARHRVWQVGHEFEDDNDAVQLRGWVEVSNIIDVNEENESEKVNRVTMKTPRHGCQKRTVDSHSSVTEPSSTADKLTPCQNCSEHGRTPSCAKCVTELRRKSPRTKLRNYHSDDDGTSYDSSRGRKRPVLSPVRDRNQESKTGLEVKGKRRLFSPCKHNASEALGIPSINGDSVSNVDTECSVSHLNLCSPTQNLPNYVIDGTSPHHYCSRNARLKENVDWLTKLRKEKMGSSKVNQMKQLIVQCHRVEVLQKCLP
ncbi:protein lethal(2)denticleless isoform X2 [Periplaneta americana]|uniref:protein lethal(2)denticleless isoform X2 n=1 Tax=Periplaneta americana TaxID=6978 RepID=UPI0037E865D9